MSEAKELKDKIKFKGMTIKFSAGLQEEIFSKKVGFYARPSSSKPDNVTLLCVLSKTDVDGTLKSQKDPNWVKDEQSYLENEDDAGQVKDSKGILLGNVIKILIAKDANKKLKSGISLIELKEGKEYLICLKEEAEENKDHPEKIKLSNDPSKIWSVEKMVKKAMAKMS